MVEHLLESSSLISQGSAWELKEGRRRKLRMTKGYLLLPPSEVSWKILHLEESTSPWFNCNPLISRSEEKHVHKLVNTIAFTYTFHRVKSSSEIYLVKKNSIFTKRGKWFSRIIKSSFRNLFKENPAPKVLSTQIKTE